MAIICPQCGFENPDGTEICEICAEALRPAAAAPVSAPAPAPVPVPAAVPASTVQTVAQSVRTPEDDREYFVFCPESQTKTVVPDGNVQRFFCEGCKLEHEIDNFLWTVEMRSKDDGNTPPAAETVPRTDTPQGDALWLEELNSHFRIDIEKPGGTLGRYGTFGAQYFQQNQLLTVSGEHCRISYEYGSWVLRHISRTNQTKYDGKILGANEPNLLEDGRILTLANAVSFVVRIG